MAGNLTDEDLIRKWWEQSGLTSRLASRPNDRVLDIGHELLRNAQGPIWCRIDRSMRRRILRFIRDEVLSAQQNDGVALDELLEISGKLLTSVLSDSSLEASSFFFFFSVKTQGF
jgi:hypothetical protein